jgi:hypothetical protein
MLTKRQTNNKLGDLALEVGLIVKLFPSMDLKNADVTKWRKYISDRYNPDKEIFETAVKEYESI